MPLPVRVRVIVSDDIDAITGLERVVFMVCDRAPERLSNETLRRADINGGLGIASELVKKFDGGISVEAAPEGWEKAVAVRLPRQLNDLQDAA